MKTRDGAVPWVCARLARIAEVAAKSKFLWWRYWCRLSGPMKSKSILRRQPRQ